MCIVTQFKMVVVVYFVITVIFFAASLTNSQYVIVISKTGNDTLECLNGTYPCRTLDYVFTSGAGLQNHCRIVIFPGDYMLQNDTVFQNYRNFSIVGLPLVRIICANEDIGISFLRSRDLLLQSLTFENCGRKRNSELRSALHFVFSRNMNISNASFHNNIGRGVSMLDVGGIVQMTRVSFTNNSLQVYGGGMYIEFTSCGALDPVTCKYQKEQQNYIHYSSYYFSKCSFTSNDINIGTIFTPETDKHIKETDSSDGKGGGLVIFLKGNSSSNLFSIADCSFSENSAKWGGGIYIELQGSSHNNVLNAVNTHFIYNSAKYAGGGVLISQIFPINKHLQKESTIFFKNCLFSHNQAIWGGGLSMRGTTRFLKYPQEKVKESLKVAFCNFTSNYATVGSAFGLSTNNLNQNPVGPGVSCKVAFDNCIIRNNKIIWTEDSKVIGLGALYGEEFILSLNETVFLQNSGSSVVLDSSSVTIHGRILFKNNSGIKGGALAMYGNSWIHMKKSSQLVFDNNTASEQGGAIYFKSSGPARLAFATTSLSTKKCFLRYEDDSILNPDLWDCSVRFINNTAPASTGNSIFANTLQDCRLYGESRIGNKTFQWKIMEYINADNEYPEIATEAAQIHAYIQDWHVSPSVPFTPRLKLYDEKNNSVFGTIKVGIWPEKKGDAYLSNDVFLVKDRIPDIELAGMTNAKFNISFITIGGQAVMTSRQRQSLSSCPPGYSQKFSKDGSCECLDVVQTGITRCENYTVFILRGYWAGFSKDGTLATWPCPRNYCSCNARKNNSIGYECPYESNFQCAANRKGILCSKCEDGHSVQLGNENCKKCSNVYLFLLIPIVIAASIFVLIVMYFNFDAFSGYLNAYLYAYQSVNLMLVENVKLDEFIGLVIGFTCLSGTGGTFGVCLFDGFTNLQKLGFNLAIPLFILLFTVLLCVFLPNKLWSKIFGSSTRMNSFGKAFSFLYVFCYTSLTSKTLDLLHPIKINGQFKLFKAADVEFFGVQHLPYAIPALVVLVVFVIGFPIILLFTPFFTERFPSISRMEPAFNALKNCFKSPITGIDTPNYRPFAAFYFICRLILLMFGIFSKEETSKLVLIATSCVFFQAIFTWCQPYVTWTLNFWDTVILTNLCVLSLMNIILSVPYVLFKADRNFLVICVKILVYVPLITVVFRFVANIHHRRTRRKKRRLNFEQHPEESSRKRLRIPFITRKRRMRSSRIPKRLEEDETPEISEANQRGFPA